MLSNFVGSRHNSFITASCASFNHSESSAPRYYTHPFGWHEAICSPDIVRAYSTSAPNNYTYFHMMESLSIGGSPCPFRYSVKQNASFRHHCWVRYRFPPHMVFSSTSKERNFLIRKQHWNLTRLDTVP